MNISEYKHGIELLKNEDNEFWINNVICWQQKEDEYNIYYFSVTVLDDNELRQIYKPITAAIATELLSSKLEAPVPCSLFYPKLVT